MMMNAAVAKAGRSALLVASAYVAVGGFVNATFYSLLHDTLHIAL